MGRLQNSFTGGRGNTCGMLGEIIFHDRYGGARVGSTSRKYDVVLPDGTKVDVKAQTTHDKTPQRAGVVRIYAPWESANWISTKCDVYYFIKINRPHTVARLLGWVTSEEFLNEAEFTPKGDVCPLDGRRAPTDEFALDVCGLRSISTF